MIIYHTNQASNSHIFVIMFLYFLKFFTVRQTYDEISCIYNYLKFLSPHVPWRFFIFVMPTTNPLNSYVKFWNNLYSHRRIIICSTAWGEKDFGVCAIFGVKKFELRGENEAKLFFYSKIILIFLLLFHIKFSVYNHYKHIVTSDGSSFLESV